MHGNIREVPINNPSIKDVLSSDKSPDEIAKDLGNAMVGEAPKDGVGDLGDVTEDEIPF